MQQQDNHEYPFLYQRQTCHHVQPNQATYQKRQKFQPATFFFFNDTATSEIYTLSLHDALPIFFLPVHPWLSVVFQFFFILLAAGPSLQDKKELEYKDRKSTRLNSSHLVISYAVFCLKKK